MPANAGSEEIVNFTIVVTMSGQPNPCISLGPQEQEPTEVMSLRLELYVPPAIAHHDEECQ